MNSTIFSSGLRPRFGLGLLVLLPVALALLGHAAVFFFLRAQVATVAGDVATVSGFHPRIADWLTGLASWLAAAALLPLAVRVALGFLGLGSWLRGTVRASLILLALSGACAVLPVAIMQARGVGMDGRPAALEEIAAPERARWFDLDGRPLLGCSRERDGRLRVWNRESGVTPDTGARVSPATPTLRREWEEQSASRTRAAQQAAQARAEATARQAAQERAQQEAARQAAQERAQLEAARQQAETRARQAETARLQAEARQEAERRRREELERVTAAARNRAAAPALEHRTFALVPGRTLHLRAAGAPSRCVVVADVPVRLGRNEDPRRFTYPAGARVRMQLPDGSPPFAIHAEPATGRPGTLTLIYERH